MSGPKLTILQGKSYLSFLRALPGAAMWQHLYAADEDGVEKDITNKGELSCAYMVSSVLVIFQKIDRAHATVASTLREMEQAGWQKVETVQPGAVVLWKDHIGFYLSEDFVISNSSKDGIVKRHRLHLDDGRDPLGFWIHPELRA